VTVPAPAKPAEGDLVRAASALEAELRRFEALPREAQRQPLTSQQALDRAADRLSEVVAAEDRLKPLLQALLAAMADVSQRHRTHGEALQAHAHALRDRRALFAALVERHAEVGREVTSVNQLAADVTRAAREAGAGKVEPEALAAVRERLAALAESAESLWREATEREFEDLARQAESLRRQLLAAVNELSLAVLGAPAANGES
jgi:chromosome segregation ATPase